VKQFVKNFVEAFEVRLGLGFPTGRVRVCEFVGFFACGGLEDSSSHKTFGCRHTWIGSKRGITVKE
jgi:hypothetical protein